MANVETISEQVATVAQRFAKTFGRAATVAVGAPGRVNLIGEHTDYNDGYVLPMAIERQTVIAAAPREDAQARLQSTGVAEEASFAIDSALAPGQPKWANYVKGPIAGYLQRGIQPGGFDALIDSTVPTGSGLSSSAALEVATATLVETLAGQSVDPVDKALICQQAEHDFAGVPCGIMDQFISAMGQRGSALLIDCRTHETRAVPLADDSITVLITNSNVAHELTGGEYAQRRSQCEAAAQTLGVKALRDATLDQLEAGRAKLDDVTYCRARHVITEIQRTLDAADAMQAGDWQAVGKLMFASHASLRDDFEVSVPELDLLVELAQQHVAAGDVIGSRMTGGGFGGCTVTLVRTDAVARVAEFIAQQYRDKTNIDASYFATKPAQGAGVLSL